MEDIKLFDLKSQVDVLLYVYETLVRDEGRWIDEDLKVKSQKTIEELWLTVSNANITANEVQCQVSLIEETLENIKVSIQRNRHESGEFLDELPTYDEILSYVEENDSDDDGETVGVRRLVPKK